ncbi:MAG: hypothetical protein RR512_01135 [Coprobacillus sp.]
MPVKYDYDWDTLHKEQQSSGMNMKKFCKERGLSYQSFKTININLCTKQM